MRSASPAEYPCFKETGFYVSTDGCRMRCCIVPAKTPDGEDSPKWAARMAAEAEAGEPLRQHVRQPDFSCTPDKTVFTHNVASDHTPDGAPGYMQMNLRLNRMHRGVPGRSDEDPVLVDTPSRQKQ